MSVQRCLLEAVVARNIQVSIAPETQLYRKLQAKAAEVGGDAVVILAK